MTSVSFVHRGGPEMASYRYRAAIPAANLGARMNDTDADIVIYAKPLENEVQEMLHARARASLIVADFCDDHFDQFHYQQFARAAHAITCPTAEMLKRIPEAERHKAAVIPDPYEFAEVEPHVRGVKCLWFGHASNLPSLFRVIRSLDEYPLMIVSNSPMAMPWSIEEMHRQFAEADIVVIPATEPAKSANRAIESIRQGCMVVAEPHPALEGIPGIWVGNIKEGVEWTRQNLSEANQWVRQAQSYVRTRFSPKTQADAWRTLFEKMKSPSISDAERSNGRAGSTSTAVPMPT